MECKLLCLSDVRGGLNSFQIYPYWNVNDFASSDTAVINFVVNDCIFTYYYHPSRSIYYALQGETSSDTSLMSTTCLFVISPLNSDVDVYFVYLNAGGGSNLSGNSYYNRIALEPGAYVEGNCIPRAKANAQSADNENKNVDRFQFVTMDELDNSFDNNKS